jgi:hypothetical protein
LSLLFIFAIDDWSIRSKSIKKNALTMKSPTHIHHSRNASASDHEDVVGDLIPALKAKVGKRLVRQFGRTVPGSLIGRALDEAVESASATGFPHLFFPALAEEKVRLVFTAISHDLRERATLRHAA